MIKIDGKFLEGGGQIVRTALALSTLLNKQFSVSDIRKGRKIPGLKAQHLTAISSLKKIFSAETFGAALKSENLDYSPGKLKTRTISVDIGTAGSITLLMQSFWIPLILKGGRFRIKIQGGTDTKWSMPVDYLKEVFLPHLRRYADADLRIIRRGYYPKGGGLVEIVIKGKYTLKTLNDAPAIVADSQGILMQIKGISHASSYLENSQVAERQARAAKHVLSRLNVPVTIDVQYPETSSAGSGITLWAIFSKDPDDIDIINPIRLGADALGEKGKKAEVVGEDAARQLIREIKSGACVDRHLADNLVPFLAIFGGNLKTSVITDHTKTNIYTVEKFLGKRFDVDEDSGRIISLNQDKC